MSKQYPDEATVNKTRLECLVCLPMRALFDDFVRKTVQSIPNYTSEETECFNILHIVSTLMSMFVYWSFNLDIVKSKKITRKWFDISSKERQKHKADTCFSEVCELFYLTSEKIQTCITCPKFN